MPIGTDPEFFFKNVKSGKMVSSIPFVPGTKHEPVKLESGGTIQRDNVAVEFATDPATSMEDFVQKVGNALRETNAKVPTGCILVAEPSAVFPNEELNNEEALVFGCDPDYDAWELMENPKPSHGNPNFRSAGAHIHVGFDEGSGNDFLLDPMGKVWTVRTMDVFHGLVSVVLDNNEASIERRKLYGSAGSHRPKEYGVEYRSLSNFWMKSPELVMLMYSLTQDVLKLIRENGHEELIETLGDIEIRNTINNGNITVATEMLEKHIFNKMSADSLHYFNECKKNIVDYEIQKTWGLMEASTNG